MKVWSDLTTLVKLSFLCLVVGFVLGLCAAGTAWSSHADEPAPVVSRDTAPRSGHPANG